MAVSIRRAISEVLRDKDFLSKYSVLIILSFCIGLISFVLIAQNYVWLYIAIPLFLAAILLLNGYHLKYLQNLMIQNESVLPEWTGNNIIEYFVIGFKYIAAAILFLLLNAAIILITTLFIAILSKFNKIFTLFIVLPLLYEIIMILYLSIGAPGLIYNFIETKHDIAAFFDIKKVLSHFSVNYFTALFYAGCISIITVFMTHCTTIRLKYALLYIIPLVISPCLGLFTNNILAQAYHSNKAGECGSFMKMFLALFLIAFFSLATVIIYFLLRIKFG